MKTLRVGAPADRRALLVHGNDLCGEFYRPLAEELAARRIATTLVTLPGFHDQPPLATAGWSPLVDALLGELDGGILIGHSLGGLLAFLAAARQPAGLTHLVLLEPAILPWRWLARSVMGRYQREVVDGDRERFTNWSGTFWRVHDEARFPPEAMALYLACRRLADRGALAALFDGIPALYPLPYRAVTVPTLLLMGGSSGRRTDLLGWLQARQLRAQRQVIPGAGHWLANQNDAAIAEKIATFVL